MKKILPQSPCPCGRLKTYAKCCGLYISGEHLPETPEALMRSRYTAYTQANIPYIQATMRGRASEGFDAASAEQWASSARWENLTVLHHSVDTNNPKRGTVEFVATYRIQGKQQKMIETSVFEKIEGRWFYVDAICN